RRVRLRRIPHGAAGRLLTLEPEAGLVGWPVDDEGELDRFPARRSVEGDDADIAVAIDPAAIRELQHQRRRVRAVEHRVTPHLPIGVARMAVVGEVQADRPAIVDAVLDLSPDLVVAEVGEEGKGALGYVHWGSPRIGSHSAAVATGTKSGESVEA